MSEYAQAINSAIKSAHHAHAIAPLLNEQEVEITPIAPHRVVERKAATIAYAETYKGHTFVIRDGGVTTFGTYPHGYGYWWIFFATDEELRLENSVPDTGTRAQICRNMIDRYVLNEPVYKGPWYKRNLQP